MSSPCRYFEKTFIEMFPEQSSISHIILYPLLIFIGCHENQNAKNRILKNYLLRNRLLYGATTMLNVSFFLYRFYVFQENHLIGFVAMATLIFHTLIISLPGGVGWAKK